MADCDGVQLLKKSVSGSVDSAEALIWQDPMPAVDHELIRITSYNVCYTKLLRRTDLQHFEHPVDASISLLVQRIVPPGDKIIFQGSP